MKILITGGSGFIGSHLGELLITQGHTVTAFDDLSTGRLSNIAQIRKHPHFRFVKGSVMDKLALAKVISRADAVFHLAAAVGVKYIIRYPLRTIAVNVEGTHNVLELAAKKKIPVLITSSSEVYGKSGTLPFTETADRTYGSAYSERWGYALSKSIDECLALAYWKEQKLPAVVVRLFNTVGPRQVSEHGMVIPTFIRQAKNGKPITVYGTGRQTRCFSHVADIVGAMAKLIQTPRAYGEIVNLGSQESVQIVELARRIKHLTKSSSRIIMIPYEKAYSKTFEDMRDRLPDLKKAKRLIRYRPQHTLDDIIRALL